jgi:hypothetical protein
MSNKIVIICILVLFGIILEIGCMPQEPSVNPSEIPADVTESTNSYLPEIPRISVEGLNEKINTNSNILIIDTRSEKAYDKSHIIGAISMTLADMEEPYIDLDGYDEIVTYCT